MRIGLDVDGVLTNYERFLIDYGSKFFQKEVVDDSGFELKDIFGVTQEEDDAFWKECLDSYIKEYPIRPFAAEVIDKLLKDGNEIYIITARYTTELDTVEGEYNRNCLIEWLKKNGINYTKIIFPGLEKLNACLENKIDIMVDDSPINIKKLQKHLPMICFDARYNKNISMNNVTRCYSFYDLYKILNSEK